ncbi:MAG TPA: response regulator transcription factor [Cyclobacteriaceae bacterium]|nr:response regulator transcription factor [Cyclobacteriaceae bacterium]
MKILIIEDESELAKSIALFLRQEGYVCEIAPSVGDAIDKITLFDYDCILLDISLPDGTGLEVLRALKKQDKGDAVIIITARNSPDDRVTGLNLGADDYLSKPFYLPELSARVSAVIRRRRFNGQTNIRFNEISIELSGKSVKVNDQEIDLTRKEYELLLFLISNKNRVASRNAIAEHLSGDDAALMDKFDFIYAHIKNLKRKLQKAGCRDYIRTVYGLGYKLTP